MKKDKGFTLLEMMVVIAIIGIVSAIAIPNVYSFAAGMKRRAASRDLYSTLQKTRMNAIRQQGTRWTVEFTSSTYKVVNCGTDNVCGGSGSADDKSIETKFSEYPGVNITILPGNVEFYPDGTASNIVTATFKDTATSDAKHTSQVEVFASGRIKSS